MFAISLIASIAFSLVSAQSISASSEFSCSAHLANSSSYNSDVGLRIFADSLQFQDPSNADAACHLLLTRNESYLEPKLVCNEEEKPEENEENVGKFLFPPRKDIKAERHFGPAYWRWLYLDEHQPEFTVRVREKTMDERLANILYTVTNVRLNNVDFYTYNTGDRKRDQQLEQMSAGSRVDDLMCDKHLEEMVADVEEMAQIVDGKRQSSGGANFTTKHYHLARVLDSFGHYESGYFSGRTHSLGTWEQCVKTQLMLSPQSGNTKRQPVDSRFCWAKLSLDKHLDLSLKQRNKSAFESTSDTLQLGVCLPSTCHTRNLKSAKNRKLIQKLIDEQFKLPKSVYVDESLPLESVFCDLDTDSPLFGIPTVGKLFLATLLAWFLLAIYATCRAPSAKKEDSILNCLNLRDSWADFIGTNQSRRPESRVNVDTLNPIRWFGCVFVTYGHGIIVKAFHSADYMRNANGIETESMGPILVNGLNLIDTFFTIGGILLAYVTMRKAKRSVARPNEATADEKAQQQQVAVVSREQSLVKQFLLGVWKLIKTRYFRLLPIFAIVYYLKKTVILYISSGPLWDYGFNKDTFYGACHQESWLTPFLFTSALLPMSRQCLLQAWSVSCDMIYTILMAPILLLMTRSPKLAASLICLICLACCILTFREMSSLDDEYDYMFRDLTVLGLGHIFTELSHIYASPLYRIYPLAIGLLAGYLLFKYDESSDYNWPNWFKGPATFASIAYLAVVITGITFGRLLKVHFAPYHMYLFPWFNTIGKLCWGLTNSIVFLRMVTDWKDSAAMRFSSNWFWQAMSKLNYAILLLHYDLLIWDSNTVQIEAQTRTTLFHSTSTVYLMCLPLATFLYVVFENPIDKLMRKYVTK